MHRRTTLPAALLAVTLLVTACGGDDASTGGEPPAADARRIEVVADDFAFSPETLEAAAGEPIAIALTSDDTVHDLTIDELDVKVEAHRGETEVAGLTVDEPGSYTFYCSISGHRSAGMEGTLLVE